MIIEPYRRRICYTLDELSEIRKHLAASCDIILNTHPRVVVEHLTPIFDILGIDRVTPEEPKHHG